MIELLPSWINILFILACVYTIFLFHFSNGKPTRITLLIILWSIIQSILAYTGFYEVVESIPPRFALILIPTTLVIICSFLPKPRKWMIKNRNIEVSTFLHSVRLPVEIILHSLFIISLVPEMMTYSGFNYDIIMGISAPIVGLLYLKNIIGKSILLVWNILGLMLIFTILIIGIFSAELPFQLFNYDQPNQAVKYFPFVLLPSTIVPLVIWTHISDIIKIIKKD